MVEVFFFFLRGKKSTLRARGFLKKNNEKKKVKNFEKFKQSLPGSIPNSLTSFRLVDTATMCLATASAPSSAVSHVRTVRALSIVSTVVKVFDTTTTSVVSGSRPLSARATSIGSTLARKRSCLPEASSADSWSVRRAVCTKSGPRKDPPMPIATTDVSGLPVAPTHSPDRTFSENALILSSTSQTSGTTSLPSATSLAPRGARVATCSTARSSVELMCSPANIAWILDFKLARSASLSSSSCVRGVWRWRERSRRTPSCSWKRASQRFSSRRRSLRWL